MSFIMKSIKYVMGILIVLPILWLILSLALISAALTGKIFISARDVIKKVNEDL